jgi:hypothetical protein
MAGSAFRLGFPNECFRCCTARLRSDRLGVGLHLVWFRWSADFQLSHVDNKHVNSLSLDLKEFWSSIRET